MAENYRIQAFRDCLDACYLMDLESKGCAFTWTNNREGSAYVKEKLDRAVCTIEWRITFPRAEVIALPALGSYHSPIMIYLFPDLVKRKKEFRFEAFWLEDAECGHIIRDVWHSSKADLLEKLRRVARELEKWSRKKFTNARWKINSLKNELMSINNNLGLGGERERIASLNGEIEKLWQQEEKY